VPRRAPTGSQSLVRMETETSVKRLSSTLTRDSYGRRAGLAWVQEEGDLKSVTGSWELEDLGWPHPSTYTLEADRPDLAFGHSGPVRACSATGCESMPAKIKAFVEGAVSPRPAGRGGQHHVDVAAGGFEGGGGG